MDADYVMQCMSKVFLDYVASDRFKEAMRSEEYDNMMIGGLNDKFGKVLSDNRQKYIRGLASGTGQLSENDVRMLAEEMGQGDSKYDPYGDDEWSEDMVQEYADNLRNFLYMYKDEATDIDPSIDPNEEHRGPMAQDIEKVAPDCVKETAQGVKVVDGDRLALVNAGVIGDLARRVLDLEARVNGR